MFEISLHFEFDCKKVALSRFSGCGFQPRKLLLRCSPYTNIYRLIAYSIKTKSLFCLQETICKCDTRPLLMPIMCFTRTHEQNCTVRLWRMFCYRSFPSFGWIAIRLTCYYPNLSCRQGAMCVYTKCIFFCNFCVLWACTTNAHRGSISERKRKNISNYVSNK